MRRNRDRQSGSPGARPPATAATCAALTRAARTRALLLPVLLLTCLFLTGAARTQVRRPNLVVILADDMGFSDLGCFGGEIRTPSLDRLAANGLRFTQFYNTARCCPTRASLLTGLYPHQAGVGHMMNDRGLPGYRGDLNRECVTLAEAVKPAGYRAYAVGKWHVTKEVAPEGPKQNWPLQRGFDRFYGTITGAGDFYDPATLTRDNAAVSAAADPEYRPARYYYTDAISDHAIRFVTDHRRNQPDRPFLLYVAYTAAHWPMHALDEDIARYRGKYDAGYDAVRKARRGRANKLGVTEARWASTPTVGDWSAVPDRAWETRCMEVYAAMVHRMDQGIGRLVQTLRTAGELDNTLLVYLQDNGGCAEGIGRNGRGAARASGPTLPPIPRDALLDAVAPKQTRDGYPVRQGEGVLPGPQDTYVAYGPHWANVSNTPFREYKHWVHEGGIATPLIVHWPAGIAARGELRHEPGHLVDILPTCLDAAAARYPRVVSGHAIQQTEGRSLLPAFSGRPLERDALYWEHEGNRAVRAGNWKLVAKGPRGPWELYDLAADRTETRDLAHAEPVRVRDLALKWEQWARRARVIPWIWGAPYGNE